MRNVFACKSELSINFDTWSGHVGIIIKHQHYHNTYFDRRLGEKTKSAIFASANVDGRASAIRQDLRSKRKEVAKATPGQVSSLQHDEKKKRR